MFQWFQAPLDGTHGLTPSNPRAHPTHRAPRNGGVPAQIAGLDAFAVLADHVLLTRAPALTQLGQGLATGNMDGSTIEMGWFPVSGLPVINSGDFSLPGEELRVSTMNLGQRSGLILLPVHHRNHGGQMVSANAGLPFPAPIITLYLSLRIYPAN